MHDNNLKWLIDLKRAYPAHFNNAAVLELGSGYGQGSRIRAQFTDCRYVGVDIVEGYGVDVVSAAKDTQFSEGEFDTLVCLSMFEHDPEWRESISHNIPWVKSGGLIIMCWGAEGNLHHGPEPWCIVPEQEALDYLDTLPIKIVDNFFEETRYGLDCAGAYDLIAIKL